MAKTKTPEQEAAIKEKRAAYQKAYREANIEKLKEKNKAWREANKDKLDSRSREWSKNNREKARAHKKVWREANREKVNELHKQGRENLTNSYVAYSMNIPISECPYELIELKRQQLMLTRMSRQLKKEMENV